MAIELEFVQGQESHSSYWGKFYIKGLEKFQVAEDFMQNRRDRHHSYQGYVVLGAPSGTLFSIFEQNGSKRGTETFRFAICVIADEFCDWQTEYGAGFVRGNFKIIAKADSRIKAPRLMGWWNNGGDQSLELAEHCAAYIDKRGMKELPPMA